MLFRQPLIAGVFLMLALVGLVARVWAAAEAKSLELSFQTAQPELFPGEDTRIVLRLTNRGFLPILWAELYFPLSKRLCLTPDGSRVPTEWERTELGRLGASTELVGDRKMPALSWYESTEVETLWRAERRGVYSTQLWTLHVGDGLGLTQLEKKPDAENNCKIRVYPELVKVDTSLFLQNTWNADTGVSGVTEDTTVIRSSRDYMLSDQVKHINWRLAARGLPLSVNTYENILPKNVHFIFDGESFSGAEHRFKELEKALSIVASLIVELTADHVRCGLSLCRGADTEAVNIFSAASCEEILGAMAEYEPRPDRVSPEDGKTVIPQPPVFDSEELIAAVQRVGRFYYVVYDPHSSAMPLLRDMDETVLTVLSWAECAAYGEYKTVGIRSLAEGVRDEKQ